MNKRRFAWRSKTPNPNTMKPEILTPLYCALLLAMAPARAAAPLVTAPNPIAVATAIDDGPEDGVFDEFTSANLGSVNNNGYTSMATAFEFDLSSIPRGSSVTAATLSVFVNFVEATRSVVLNGSSDDGGIQLSDFASQLPI